MDPHTTEQRLSHLESSRVVVVVVVVVVVGVVPMVVAVIEVVSYGEAAQCTIMRAERFCGCVL